MDTTKVSRAVVDSLQLIINNHEKAIEYSNQDIFLFWSQISYLVIGVLLAISFWRHYSKLIIAIDLFIAVYMANPAENAESIDVYEEKISHLQSSYKNAIIFIAILNINLLIQIYAFENNGWAWLLVLFEISQVGLASVFIYKSSLLPEMMVETLNIWGRTEKGKKKLEDAGLPPAPEAKKKVAIKKKT